MNNKLTSLIASYLSQTAHENRDERANRPDDLLSKVLATAKFSKSKAGRAPTREEYEALMRGDDMDGNCS